MTFPTTHDLIKTIAKQIDGLYYLLVDSKQFYTDSTCTIL